MLKKRTLIPVKLREAMMNKVAKHSRNFVALFSLVLVSLLPLTSRAQTAIYADSECPADACIGNLSAGSFSSTQSAGDSTIEKIV
jgi:hypothetical protein